MIKNTESDPEQLREIIIESIQEKKGKQIVIIDLTEINNSVCDFFIISHGESGTQAKAIAQNIEVKVKQTVNEKVYHREGYENAQWILLDYSTVVVHIFQKELRDHYKLEALWADGAISQIGEVE
ncbi:MAG: ribosome silencing factor [Bacteroidales bacterium]|nr:ribosome silencing factor [Bacteroidales bacterium]